MTPRYKYIFFDADDTLYDFKKTQQEAFNKFYEHFCLKGLSILDAYTLYQTINHKLWVAFERGEVDQPTLRLKRFEFFMLELGLTELSKTPERLADYYELALGEGRYLIHGAEELVRQLSRKFELAIITNGLKNVQESRLLNSSISSFFKSTIISGVVGYSKPQREIFQIAQNETGFYPNDQVLFVGDSLTSDIAGAHAFGFDTCWYNPHKISNTSLVQPSYEIHQLEELYTILSF